MSEVTGLLIFADGRDAAAWRRGTALAREWRRRKVGVLLRDGALVEEVVTAFPDDALQTGAVAQFLRLEYQALCQHFRLDSVLWLPPLRPAMEEFLASLPWVRLLPAPASEAAVSAPEAAAGPRLVPSVPLATRSVLIVTHDLATCATKTSEWIAQACEELGVAARLENSSPLRALCMVTPDEPEESAGESLAKKIAARFDQLTEEAAADTVVALDLNWFLDKPSLLDLDRVKRVISLWYDDVKSWCQASYNVCVPGAIDDLQAALRHPKVIHCCYGRGQLDEMRRLGFGNVRFSYLAAPTAYLRRHAAPEITDRAAFIGNPGLIATPPPRLLELLALGIDLDGLRAYAQNLALVFVRHHFAGQIAREPTVLKLLSLAIETKLQFPYTSASSLLQGAATHYPAAFEVLNQSGEVLNGLAAIKMVTQFDRPALVVRLQRAGLLDVYSRADEWRSYGVEARPDVLFPDLPSVYQRYGCHLNGYNSGRDATANEKLFEIAACGRVSVNLSSPDVHQCYEEGEVAFAGSLAEAEERVRGFLADPDAALAYGSRARHRTAREHLWTHRLRSLFAAPGTAGAEPS